MKPLDREAKDTYEIIVKATEDCNTVPSNLTNFDKEDETTLKVVIKLIDVNDNAPKFTSKVFTGGVTTDADFGTEFMQVKAIDADTGTNAIVKYYLVGKIQMTLTEGFEDIQLQPFLVDESTGGVLLNFDPQPGMKGYFDFTVRRLIFFC